MTAELVRVLLVGLAAWRLASLLVAEYGPFNIFWLIRRWLGVERDDEGMVAIEEEGWLRTLLDGVLSCVWCAGLWTAFLFWALWEVHWMIVGVPAAASIVVLVEQAVRRA